MEVTNDTSYPIKAFGWHRDYGYGEKTDIKPGESSEVSGPFVGEMGGGDCHLHLEGKIICHEGPDDEKGFHVSLGKKLILGSDKKGISIFHYEDPVDF